MKKLWLANASPGPGAVHGRILHVDAQSHRGLPWTCLIMAAATLNDDAGRFEVKRKCIMDASLDSATRRLHCRLYSDGRRNETSTTMFFVPHGQGGCDGHRHQAWTATQVTWFDRNSQRSSTEHAGRDNMREGRQGHSGGGWRNASGSMNDEIASTVI